MGMCAENLSPEVVVFGCHPTHPADRFDNMGLVWMIADAEVVAMRRGR